MNSTKHRYFEWLYDFVCDGKVNSEISYKKLFSLLFDVEFIFYIRNDLNRARDGIDLRYRFAMLENDENILHELEGPCSVLEMIIALALRCEETIMDDAKYGNRTKQWFWKMLANLGIGYMNDKTFDEDLALERIYIFMERRYSPDGRGGLFYIKNCQEDLRNVEIWTQLNWYLDDNYV